MNKYIKGIIVFKDENSKSLLEFRNGINIITGESKTGKSALIEIIDYCLCSSRNPVPKGVIKNYGTLYTLIICVGEKAMIIARRASDGKMALIFDSSEVIIDNINIDDFTSFSNPKDIQKIIEENLGLTVTNLNANPFIQNKGKASIRNMLSYVFQHQSNIASKFVLFSRFTDSEKRMQVIEQFPIFAGIVDQQYYSTLIELKEIEQEIRNVTRRKELEEKSYHKMLEELFPLLTEYYALIGQDVPEYVGKLDTDGLIKFASNLPSDDFNFINKDIVDNYTSIKHDIESLSIEISDIKLKIDSLNDTNHDIFSYLDSIDSAIEIANLSHNDEKYICPICKNFVDEINADFEEMIESKNKLKLERNFACATNKHFLEEKRKLSKLLNDKKKKLKSLYKEKKYIEDHYLNNNELIDKEEKKINAKLRIKYYLEILVDKAYMGYSDRLKELSEKSDELKKILEKFNLKDEIQKISDEINSNMNRIAQTLDFEEDFYPLNLKFDLETFDLYNFKDGEKVGYSEMGSGANWLSCHIALFLSLLHSFTKRHEKSPMLLFLFFDQPSQIYFPDYNSANENNISNDIDAISRIFKTIFDEFDIIQKETGIMPQLILTEHVRGENLKLISDKYIDRTIKHWSSKTGKFIDIEN